MHCKKQTFGTSDLFIHCNKHSCSEHIAGDVNIFLYGCVSLMPLECCVFVCVWYQITVPAKNQTSVNLMPCYIKNTSSPPGIKVPRLDMCRSIVSLSKIAHQIWRDNPSSQRIRQQKELELGVGGNIWFFISQ